jgi:hypothetical protein
MFLFPTGESSISTVVDKERTIPAWQPEATGRHSARRTLLGMREKEDAPAADSILGSAMEEEK